MNPHIIQRFEGIASEEALAAFVAELSLKEQPAARGDQRSYSGNLGAQIVEVHERWWDPSHAYRVERDRHEVTLHIDGVKVRTIQFLGGS